MQGPDPETVKACCVRKLVAGDCMGNCEVNAPKKENLDRTGSDCSSLGCGLVPECHKYIPIARECFKEGAVVT